MIVAFGNTRSGSRNQRRGGGLRPLAAASRAACRLAIIEINVCTDTGRMAAARRSRIGDSGAIDSSLSWITAYCGVHNPCRVHALGTYRLKTEKSIEQSCADRMLHVRKRKELHALLCLPDMEKKLPCATRAQLRAHSSDGPQQ